MFYITMMVLWEHREMNVKELGTLTPVLKTLEQKGYITRKNDEVDERVLNVAITQTGDMLRDKALKIKDRNYEMGGRKWNLMLTVLFYLL